MDTEQLVKDLREIKTKIPSRYTDSSRREMLELGYKFQRILDNVRSNFAAQTFADEAVLLESAIDRLADGRSSTKKREAAFYDVENELKSNIDFLLRHYAKD